ncbi:MAG TPA: sigma-54 dependent transcriptional regulator, partial [Terriglobales bacterium]|nr:sigma-54 dependent transcriptional regulator [Terriglobales bacterium]
EVALVANVDIPVLMLGESGTGKEIIARLIHKRSARAHKPFMKVNCAALPGDLLESELFGYEPGAFTGANKAKPGKFEQCNKGTLMLDEVGEMPVQLQAKLLHVLQDGEFSRLGSRTSIKVDVRVLAATNIDVQKSIANKTFREDLYYRLNAFTVNVPPLRERREEVPFLLRHYMNRMSESYGRLPIPLSPRLVDACQNAAWPGNVRELSNFVKRFLILGDEDMVLAELVRSDADSAPPVENLKDVARGAKNGAEAEAIQRALQQTGWNKKRAATLLKISYKALLYKIQEYGIRAPAARARFQP